MAKAKPKKPVKSVPTSKITMKCVSGHKYELTQEQLARANDLGCAMCDCGMPAFIVKVEAKNVRV